MQLTLLVPELIWPEPEDHDTLDALDTPGLSALLSRSHLLHRPPQSLEATLTDSFAHAEGAPYAAFRRLGESAQSGADDACWLCCDPVHLRFHQNLLILADSSSFGISLEEAQTLVTELNKHLADAGSFHVATAERWYLQLADTASVEDFDVPPLSAVAGRSIDRLLPETTRAKELRKLLNEAQMILHAHPVNQQRENEGRPTINSLWLWGAGTLPQRREIGFDGVWSTNPLALGLARAAGVPTHPVPVDAATLLEHAAQDTSHLIVLEDLLGPVQYENGTDYRKALSALEERWFAPLRTALASGAIRQLRIEASTAYAALAWKSRRIDQWKLWRRPQALVEVARNLAKGAA